MPDINNSFVPVYRNPQKCSKRFVVLNKAMESVMVVLFSK